MLSTREWWMVAKVPLGIIVITTGVVWLGDPRSQLGLAALLVFLGGLTNTVGAVVEDLGRDRVGWLHATGWMFLTVGAAIATVTLAARI